VASDTTFVSLPGMFGIDGPPRTGKALQNTFRNKVRTDERVGY
jgi:hypothetical protein